MGEIKNIDSQILPFAFAIFPSFSLDITLSFVFTVRASLGILDWEKSLGWKVGLRFFFRKVPGIEVFTRIREYILGCFKDRNEMV